ncbi:MAG: minichromosome maintenance protein MCM, partial [Candidatus Aenigmarchaeota archaeon]|nr:minichromosome maintenance protein MCM [Candidatus Aenigmarchaeota archaeon]
SKPKIDQVLIRKYIAYAKENSKPKIVPEVGRLLKNFYVKTRKQAEGAGAPVPITLRQLEALMRIAQASAKIQLQKEVRREDAQRAIKLMKYSLQQLGFDPDTGMIDVDRSEGAVTSAERSRIRIILDIIDEMSATKKEILVEDIIKTAKKEDVEEVEEILEKLKREGMLFEPSPGYVQKV